MKLALIADLHANREAFEAVLEHAERQRAQRYGFLGDFVGYGADPDWVLESVRSHVDRGAIAVLGNHDQGVLDGPSPHMLAAAREVVDWTRAHLRAPQLEFLRARHRARARRPAARSPAVTVAPCSVRVPMIKGEILVKTLLGQQ